MKMKRPLVKLRKIQEATYEGKNQGKSCKCDKVCKNKCDHWYSDCDISNMRCVRNMSAV
jgi:hypothetical protein